MQLPTIHNFGCKVGIAPMVQPLGGVHVDAISIKTIQGMYPTYFRSVEKLGLANECEVT
jgi:hypothetical protein